MVMHGTKVAPSMGSERTWAWLYEGEVPHHARDGMPRPLIVMRGIRTYSTACMLLGFVVQVKKPAVVVL